MPLLESNNASMFYTDEGLSTALPILLIHEWTCDSHDWMFQISFLLSKGHRVVTPDLRGNGASTALSNTEAIIMGHSLGAKEVASTLATQNPEVVEALILVDVVYNDIKDPGVLKNVIQMFRVDNSSAIVATGMVSDQFSPPSTPAWLKTWHGSRTLATPLWVIGGCYRDHHVDGEIRANPETAAEFMRKRKAPWMYVEWNEEGADNFRLARGGRGMRIAP